MAKRCGDKVFLDFAHVNVPGMLEKMVSPIQNATTFTLHLGQSTEFSLLHTGQEGRSTSRHSLRLQLSHTLWPQGWIVHADLGVRSWRGVIG